MSIKNLRSARPRLPGLCCSTTMPVSDLARDTPSIPLRDRRWTRATPSTQDGITAAASLWDTEESVFFFLTKEKRFCYPIYRF